MEPYTGKNDPLPEQKRPKWDADHYSAEVGHFVLHIYRNVRRRKPGAKESLAQGNGKMIPYEYYSWSVLGGASEDREAGCGVATTRELAEAACMAAVRAAAELPDGALPRRPARCNEEG